MKFSETKVKDLGTHQLSLYYGGPCPHGCRYCWVYGEENPRCFRNRKFKHTLGELRINEKALDLVQNAKPDNVKCLVISLHCDPLPFSRHEDIMKERLHYLGRILYEAEQRAIPVKVLTKNAWIAELIHNEDGAFQHIQVGMSITSHQANHKVVQRWEPGASPIAARLDALMTLKRHGFRTWVIVEPPLPKTDFYSLLYELEELKPEEIIVGKGSYVKELETAFNWREVAHNIEDYRKNSQLTIKFKKELRHYLLFREKEPLMKFFDKKETIGEKA